MARPFKVTVGFMSGNTLTFDCDEFTTSKRRVDGVLTSAEWTNATPAVRTLSIDRIEYITVEDN